ncbi:MAG TPA: flagellar basal body L-ring protein FlgH [Acetobacteraceae bacterium]|nr:flagellar basal body L-ring protein FlgH [Acetobacteraceae bacterium]
MRLASVAAVTLSLASCGALDRLSNIGRPPPMTPPSDPTAAPTWRPITMPMPHAEPAPTEAASLWRSGSRAFFKDERAAQVGDIVTVLVNTTDTADVENASSEVQNGGESMGMPNMLGLEAALPKLLSKAVNPSSLVSTTSNSTAGGTGTIKRNETVDLRLAGVITQVLPNGNLVVVARQEMRVNSELRVLEVSGVIRPQDIASDNTVSHDRMAEARISYGGKGQLTNIQTPRYGQQALDILLPF